MKQEGLESALASSASQKGRRPPARLSWPLSWENSRVRSRSQSQDQNSKDSFAASSLSPRKRPRRQTPASTATTNTSTYTNTAALWVDTYAPASSIDLCVAPKKVKECKAWLEAALQTTRFSAATNTTTSTPPWSSDGSSSKLLILVGSPGIGKSTMVRVLAKELDLEIHAWNESFVPRNRGGRALDQVLSIERSSAIDSFKDFLRQAGAGFASLDLTGGASKPLQKAGRPSIVLLEELPNLHGLEAESKFRDIMKEYLQASRVPTILIFSDVCEGKHKPEDLERLIDRKTLYSTDCTICQIHPTTKPKFKKILEKICSLRKLPKLPPSLVEELHLQSRGDIRHAIMSLQVQSTGVKSIPTITVSRSTKQNHRDSKLSTFHALGKCLYAKREMDQTNREVLAFDPEEILAGSELGVGGSLRFLEYHSAEFFSDIEDLSNAYELYSDAELILKSAINRRVGSSAFDDLCASSLAGRAVAKTNRSPTPNKFRQFSVPTVFDVLRKGRQNQILVDQLARRLTNAHISPLSAIGSSHAFVTELLPGMRTIVPKVVDPSVDDFFSIIREQNDRKRYSEESQSAEEAASLERQAEILKDDDIADFDSDDE